MALSLITLARVAEEASHHATAAKLLAPFAVEASHQHFKNFRTAHQQISELLADGDTSEASLIDALQGMIGLCQFVRNRDDLPTEARQALTHNHRLIAAYEALSAAGVEGFQPSDFDLHKRGA